MDDFGTAAVVKTEINDAASVVFGLIGNPVASLDNFLWKRCIATTEDDLDIVLHEGLEFAAAKDDENIHEVADFLGTTLEVFGRKDIEASDFDAAIEDVIGESFEVFEASVVTLHTGEAALFCPATIAVNNNGDVGRKFDSLSV